MKEYEFFSKTVDVRKDSESPLVAIHIVTQDDERVILWVGDYQARCIAQVAGK